MKYLAGLTLVVILTLQTGCFLWQHKKTAAKPPTTTATRPIVTPDASLAATVLIYNPVGRFVVLNFPADNLPKQDQVLFLYHGGLKAGEVKITGPQHDNNVVADLISGAAQAGDEVRDQ